MNTRALVGNIQRYSTEDGPGIRTTVFLKGCPLACAWCHNPELIGYEQQIIFSPSKCISCAYCKEACPLGAIEMVSGDMLDRLVPLIDRESCTACGACARECYAGALASVAKPMSASEVMDVVRRDRSFYENTGGGLTLSGGEALTHADFCEELISLAHEEGVSVCLDTSGFAPRETLARLVSMPAVSDVLYDLKAMNDEVHKKYTGVSNELILSNLAYLASEFGLSAGSGSSTSSSSSSSKPKIHIRIPLVSGVNDDLPMLEDTAVYLAGLGISDVTLIPYHKLGVGKARNIGSAQDELAPPSDAELARIRDVFRAHGSECVILGDET